jgi:hypothetical protein
MKNNCDFGGQDYITENNDIISADEMLTTFDNLNDWQEEREYHITEGNKSYNVNGLSGCNEKKHNLTCIIDSNNLVIKNKSRLCMFPTNSVKINMISKQGCGFLRFILSFNDGQVLIDAALH